jgi:hypothetical protein
MTLKRFAGVATRFAETAIAGPLDCIDFTRQYVKGPLPSSAKRASITGELLRLT